MRGKRLDRPQRIVLNRLASSTATDVVLNSWLRRYRDVLQGATVRASRRRLFAHAAPEAQDRMVKIFIERRRFVQDRSRMATALGIKLRESASGTYASIWHATFPGCDKEFTYLQACNHLYLVPDESNTFIGLVDILAEYWRPGW